MFSVMFVFPIPVFSCVFFVQFWKRSHGAENYLKTVINKEVFKIKKFSKVCVEATVAEMTFLPRDFLQKAPRMPSPGALCIMQCLSYGPRVLVQRHNANSTIEIL